MKGSAGGLAVAAWLLAATYYFYQYALRSAPGVMMPQLAEAFGLSPAGMATTIGLFYYGYAPFSLVAGAAVDRLGAKAVVPVGAFMTGVGALLFATGNLAAANVGRFLQGAGGVFALIGAIYIVTQSFPPSRAATLIGATQMFGSSGGSAGQFLVGPMIAAGLAWNTFWAAMGIAGVIIAFLLALFLPKSTSKLDDGWLKSSAAAIVAVFRNPQSLLCGLIAGLLFIPTTVFDMIWGVRFLQEGRGFDYADAVIRSATVPVGWVIGSPLLGMISDRLGRRKPVLAAGAAVLLACLAWILYGQSALLPPHVLGLVTGISSGAAMLPYTIIKETNQPTLAGTSTGVISFMNFSFSALAGALFGIIMSNISGGDQPRLEQYQTTFQPLLFGVALALVLTFGLRETGPAMRLPAAIEETV